MTIVAGFNFADGVLICADTKHTGPTNHYQPKIRTKEYKSGAKSIFGLAGRSHLASQVIQECERDLELLADPTIMEMEDKVSDVLIRIHQKHVFPHPLRGQDGGPDFYLMIGLWSVHDGQPLLYTTEETALDRVATFECMGSGEYLGRYIIEPSYANPMAPLKDVIFTAITALGRIKKFDPNCGGKSQFVVLRRNGEMAHESEFDISQTEAFSDTFFHYANAVYSMIADHPLSDEDVRKHIEWFLEDINRARGNLQTEKDYREALIKNLSGG